MGKLNISQTTLYMIGIYQRTNMATILHIQVTLPSFLQAYRSNTGPYPCQKHNPIQHLFHVNAMHLTEKKYASLTAIICLVFYNHIWVMHVHICTTHEVTGTNCVMRSTVQISCKLQLKLLQHINQQICLPKSTYKSHCPHTLCTYSPDTTVHVFKHSQLQHLLRITLA